MAGNFFGGPFFGGGFFGQLPSGAKSGQRGQRGRKEVRIKLGDKSREDTAEFLKAQLKLRHPDSAFQPEVVQPVKPKITKAERALAAKLKAEALRVALYEKQQAEIKIYNEELIKLIYLASL